MKTWNTIARSKRTEWRRKDGRLGWLQEQHAAMIRLWFELAQASTGWRIIKATAPGTDRLDCRPGEIIYAVSEGPTYIHTYTPGHPWEWQPEAPESDE